MVRDTIFALSSGALPAGIAVVRISGPKAHEALATLCKSVPVPRTAVKRVIHAADGNVIDEALVLVFSAPLSFTGEDCVEIHTHGSRAVAAALYGALSRIPGLRLADAGEFSRRAFENGKLDLVEIEGLADLLQAETEMQRRLAIEQGLGRQSALYSDWSKRLTYARAMIEAELDFADEEDIPGSVSDRTWAAIASLKQEIDDHLATAAAGEIIRDGFKVVIAGPPNAGKSSLLNRIGQRDIAIVTDIAGTTRDILTVDVDLDGYLVRFFDTAGLHESEDTVEREGIRRAKDAARSADLLLLLSPIDSGPQHFSDVLSTDMIRVGTKADIFGESGRFDICISTETGDGIDALKALIAGRVATRWQGGLSPVRERQRIWLGDASHLLQEALEGSELDLRAESLRAAAASIGRITGRVDAEHLLDVIFGEFCIGK